MGARLPSEPQARRLGLGGQQHLHGPIEVRVERVGQLFHTLDPFPFRERDLDAGVEEYVVGWAGEIAGYHPISIVIHMPPAEAQRDEAQHIEEAIRNYFAYRAGVLGWDLRDLFRIGRASLTIGIAVLAACIVVGKVAGGFLGTGYVGRFFDEGLIILGWVANWRPVEIFLYDWWPIVRRRQLYLRLAQVPVQIAPDEEPAGQTGARNQSRAPSAS
jgi:hypothetical protein